MWFDKSLTWKKSQTVALAMARARTAMVWGTSQLTREASFSAKALENIYIWKGLIRPHLEYGAEVMDVSLGGSWAEAEKVGTKMGRKILRCGPTTTNELIN
jgi:hypothetical protein